MIAKLSRTRYSLETFHHILNHYEYVYFKHQDLIPQNLSTLVRFNLVRHDSYYLNTYRKLRF